MEEAEASHLQPPAFLLLTSHMVKWGKTILTEKQDCELQNVNWICEEVARGYDGGMIICF